jgi:hypothetical protein
MREFIVKHPELIYKILEVEGFNKEKLENILKITSNDKLKFEFAGSCPHGLYLQVELKNKVDNLVSFIEFIKEKGLYDKNYKITKRDYGDYAYSVTVDNEKPSEVDIEFYNSWR